MRYIPNDALHLVYRDEGGVSKLSEQWMAWLWCAARLKIASVARIQNSYKVEDELTTWKYQTTENHVVDTT